MANNSANADGERGVVINTASVSAFEGWVFGLVLAHALASVATKKRLTSVRVWYQSNDSSA